MAEGQVRSLVAGCRNYDGRALQGREIRKVAAGDGGNVANEEIGHRRTKESVRWVDRRGSKTAGGRDFAVINPIGNRHGKESTKIGETGTDKAINAQVIALGRPASRADKRTLRLDHSHRPCQPEPRSDEGMVRQSLGLEVPTELPDARRRRVPPLCVLREGRRRNSSQQSSRGTRQSSLHTRR